MFKLLKYFQCHWNMHLISKLLIKMKFDSQHTRKTANQFLQLANRPAYSNIASITTYSLIGSLRFYPASLPNAWIVLLLVRRNKLISIIKFVQRGALIADRVSTWCTSTKNLATTCNLAWDYFICTSIGPMIASMH